MYEIVFPIVFTVILLQLFKKYSFVFGMVDIPSSRSIHTKPTPRGGGIVFIGVMIISIMLFYIDIYKNFSATLLALVIIWITGIIDDIHFASPKFKFASIAVATLLLSYNGIVIESVSHFANTTISLGVFTLPFTYFAIAGYTNAFNLIDGIDMLATITAIVISFFLLYLGYTYEDKIVFTTSLILLEVLVGFLVFNTPPASIFMGDSGSLSIGFILSILFIKSLSYIPAVAVLYFGALPIIDTLVSMLRRYIDTHPLSKADRCHLHHILLQVTKSHKKSLFILISLQIFMMLLGWILMQLIDTLWMLILFFVIVAVIYFIVQKLRKRYALECYS